MPPKAPQIWPSTCYVRKIQQQHGGVRAFTHLAQLISPTGELCRGYVKHFPASAPRGLFNEWFGYTAMSALSIPQPACAFMEAPIDGVTAWAFVSLQPSPSFEGTPKEQYNTNDAAQLPALIKRLLDCHDLPRLMAADQLIMNGDRNLGNLVFTGKRSFVAIDHSDILGGPDWELESLIKTTTWSRSKIIEDLIGIKNLRPSTCGALVAAAEIVQQAYFDTQIELKMALNAGTNRDAEIAIEALWWRCLEIASWFRNRLKLLI